MAIEFLDELVFGVREAAWPAIRADLGLSYSAIGVALTVPILVSGVLEPLVGVLGDSGKRRVLVVAGGVAFAGALVLVGYAHSFGALLLGFMIFYPASGAFVSLSQATLMDRDPDQRERNMARWVVAGSVGVVVGPLVVAAAITLGWGWRPVFLALAVGTIPLVLGARSSHGHQPGTGTFRQAAGAAWTALRNREVIRWLMVLELSDLVGDVLTGFLALYFVDVVRVTAAHAALAVVVWTLAGLAGDVTLVRLVARISGVAYLRAAAATATVVFPALLLAPGLPLKLALLAILGVVSSGWYAISQGRLYGELPGSSGAALALSNVSAVVAAGFPLLVGVLAERHGLGSAIWGCALAPPAILVALHRVPRPSSPVL